jgi:hypothetical protein
MSCYVSSNENRFYAALEQSYGNAALVDSANRLSALKLSATQEAEKAVRRDKTGSRTFVGLPFDLRRETSFEVKTYMASWRYDQTAPAYGPLVEAALGAPPLQFAGGSIESLASTQLRFNSPHNLADGQAVSCGGEIRFAAAVLDDRTIAMNAPFTGDQAAGWPVDRTVTYRPQTQLPSASIYDYWSPGSSVHRLLSGAAVNRMKVGINGDFHEFSFSGKAADLVDNASFISGQAGLTEFPVEPEQFESDYSLVPGHLGQVWMGTAPEMFFTLTGAEVSIDNDLDLRANEFGLSAPRCVAAGVRAVTTTFSIYEKPDAATRELYQAARQRAPISMMYQLGQQPSQLCGVYMKSVVPEVPEFIDDEAKLEWKFLTCRAQGTLDDEIYIAFG